MWMRERQPPTSWDILANVVGDRRSLVVFAGLFAVGCGRAPIIVDSDEDTEGTDTTAGSTTGGVVEPGTSTGQQVDVDTATTDGDGTDETSGGATDETTAGVSDDTTTDATTDATTDTTTDTTSGGPCDGVMCDDDEVCIAGVCFPTATSTGECQPGPGTWADCPDGEACGGGGQCVSAGEPGQGSCIFDCNDACDCPAAPPTGDAEPACEDIAGAGGPDGMLECYLSCENGETCPDGQECLFGLLCGHTNASPSVGPYEGCDPPDLPCEDGMICVFGDIDVNASCLQQGCMTEADCPPAPPGGTVVCADVVPGGGNECYLDCAGGTPCPAGWECFQDIACLQPLPGPPVPGYASCVPVDQCVAGEVCYSADANGGSVTVNVCSAPDCPSAAACPLAPASGNAVPACGDVGGGNDTCYLDCSGGETCPTGMLCADGTYCAFDSADLCVGAVGDPSFESGTPNIAWDSDDNQFPGLLPICDEATCGLDAALSGDFFLWFGGFDMGMNTDGYAEQDIVIPTAAASLSMYLHMATVTTVNPENDFVEVLVDGNQEFIATGADAAMYSTYTEVLVDVSAYADDGVHTVRVAGVTAGIELTNMFVDDVTLVCD